LRAAIHFVGFRDDRYHAAVRIFGPPDFFHFHWDERAKNGGEIGPDNIFIFATGDEHQPVQAHAWDDSVRF
jgi:hypothetical protein